MIEITESQWRLLMFMGVGAVALVVSMFVYVVKTARAAYLGDRWIMAAGSYERAARELRRFDCETDAMMIKGAHKMTPGAAGVVARNRASVEKAMGLETPERVGMLVLDDGRSFPWHDGMRVTCVDHTRTGEDRGYRAFMDGAGVVRGMAEIMGDLERARKVAGAPIQNCDACGHSLELHPPAGGASGFAHSCLAPDCTCPDFRKFPA